MYTIAPVTPEARRLSHGCTMGGRTGRCRRRPEYTLSWPSRRGSRAIAIFRAACTGHARQFATCHQLAWPFQWIRKIQQNAARDRERSRELRAAGWIVLRVWESDIRANGGRVV